VIFVDHSLLSSDATARFRFTLAHELGHLSLHRNLPLDFELLDATSKGILDARQDLRLGRRELKTPRDWLEWQANYYAGCLLIPRAMLGPELERRQHLLGVRLPGRIYVDDQPDNMASYISLVEHLRATFQTSKTTTRIRLEQLGLLEDRRTPRERGPSGVSVGAALAELFSFLGYY
jgi:Zn-dependent peptidase ImmA (M78 family)